MEERLERESTGGRVTLWVAIVICRGKLGRDVAKPGAIERAKKGRILSYLPGQGIDKS